MLNAPMDPPAKLFTPPVFDTQTPSRSEFILEVENLTKRFPSVCANDQVSFAVRKGEIHAILGENGAGKSTLMECLYGYYQPDSGQIRFQGQPVRIPSPQVAIALGIGLVHQHFVLVEPLSVLDNILLGSRPARTGGILLNTKEARRRLSALCDTYGVALDLDTPLGQLSVGQQQWVEILKALFAEVQLLILDEPTAVLTAQESERLFTVLQQMQAQGLSIILISHKLEEVIRVSQRVTILRKGKRIDTVDTETVTKADLARMMVGREVVFEVKREPLDPGEPILEIRDLECRHDRGQLALRQISLTVHRHEILGLASIAGNGQKELSEALIGIRPVQSGQIRLAGKEITHASPQTRIRKGMATIPQDRLKEGLIPEFSVAENLILGLESRPPFRRGFWLHPPSIRRFAERCLSEFDIATPSAQQLAGTLSGGNLQKVILARELSQQPRFLLANHPSRGLDVGAIESVHARLLAERQRGSGILLFSEELEELFMLADRIAVLYQGQILGTFLAASATLETVGLLMAGIREAS